MLRRKPTRIELGGEDVEEYEKAKKLWTKDTKKDTKKDDDADIKGQSLLLDDSPLTALQLSLNDPKRILKIHERIGYKPETVPSDGTTTFLS